jgi:hypothetical protein
MSLRILERLKGKQYRERKKTLRTGGLNFCALLSSLGLVLEAGLLGGEVIFFTATAELFFPDFSWSLWNKLINAELYLYAAYCFNYILVESMYVCSGFGLYINSRVETEGWDIRLLFQKFTSRPAVKGAALFLGFMFMLTPLSLRADEEEPAPEPKVYFPETFMPLEDASWESLNEILESDEFGSVKEGWEIQLKDKKSPMKDRDINFAPWLEQLKQMFAVVLRALIVLAIAGFGVFAFIRLYQLRRSSAQSGKRDGVFRISQVSVESPEKLFEKAAAWYAQGSVREAWAACLCGTITAYTRYRSLSFPQDATEYDCLDLVRTRFGPDPGGFGELVKNWVLLAYGGQIPGEGSFEKALEFGRSLKEVPVA